MSRAKRTRQTGKQARSWKFLAGRTLFQKFGLCLLVRGLEIILSGYLLKVTFVSDDLTSIKKPHSHLGLYRSLWTRMKRHRIETGEWNLGRLSVFQVNGNVTQNFWMKAKHQVYLNGNAVHDFFLGIYVKLGKFQFFMFFVVWKTLTRL